MDETVARGVQRARATGLVHPSLHRWRTGTCDLQDLYACRIRRQVGFL